MIVPDYILDSLSMIGLIAGRADDATLDVEQICGTAEYFALALSADIVIRFMLDEVLNEGGEFDAIDVLKRLSWIKLHQQQYPNIDFEVLWRQIGVPATELAQKELLYLSTRTLNGPNQKRRKSQLHNLLDDSNGGMKVVEKAGGRKAKE